MKTTKLLAIALGFTLLTSSALFAEGKNVSTKCGGEPNKMEKRVNEKCGVSKGVNNMDKKPANAKCGSEGESKMIDKKMMKTKCGDGK